MLAKYFKNKSLTIQRTGKHQNLSFLMYSLSYPFSSKPDDRPAPIQKKYNYNMEAFEKINSPQFIEMIKKQEEKKKKHDPALDGLKFPLLLIASSLFIYWCWETIPYAVVYKHVTISDKISQGYPYAIFLSALSFKNSDQILMYMPILALGLQQTSKFFRQRHMVGLFCLNSVITWGVTLQFQTNNSHKMHGGVTALAFVSCFSVMDLTFLIFKQKMLPFYLLPIILMIYEIKQCQEENPQICRQAHIAAIVNGMIYGLIFKKIFYKK